MSKREEIAPSEADRTKAREVFAQVTGHFATMPSIALDPTVHIARALAEARAEGAAAMRERCAKVADNEATRRRERMNSGDPNWGDPMAQGHKSVTAVALAAAIRALTLDETRKSTSELSQDTHTG